MHYKRARARIFLSFLCTRTFSLKTQRLCPLVARTPDSTGLSPRFADTYLVGCGGGVAAGLADGQINPACNSPLDNPGLVNVRERIRIIYRPDAAGTTLLWMINFQAIALNDTANGKFGYTQISYSGSVASPTAGNSTFVALKANTAPDVNSYPFWNPCCCCDAYTVCEKKTYGCPPPNPTPTLTPFCSISRVNALTTFFFSLPSLILDILNL